MQVVISDATIPIGAMRCTLNVMNRFQDKGNGAAGLQDIHEVGRRQGQMPCGVIAGAKWQRACR